MNEAVLDASVLLKWFATTHERGSVEAQDLRRRFENTELGVVVPALASLEILNVAGRRWGWQEASLLDLAAALEALQIEVGAAELSAIATWTGRGLTAYDAAYVALAETLGVPLVTDDESIVSLAEGIAVPLRAR